MVKSSLSIFGRTAHGYLLFDFTWTWFVVCQVNTFIHCYVAARKIVSIHDLEVEICKNEGIGQFEELGLGPFLQHPLVAHYFFVPADLSKVPKLSSEEIISCLQKFIDNSKEKVTAESFLDYLAEQKSVSGKEKLGVRVQSLGYVPSLFGTYLFTFLVCSNVGTGVYFEIEMTSFSLPAPPSDRSL